MYIPYLIFNNLLSRFTSYFVIKDEIYLKTIMFTLLPTPNLTMVLNWNYKRYFSYWVQIFNEMLNILLIDGTLVSISIEYGSKVDKYIPCKNV